MENSWHMTERFLTILIRKLDDNQLEVPHLLFNVNFISLLKILRFYGYWDDRETQFGELHDLEIRFYPSDDTIDMKDVTPSNVGGNSGCMFLRRCKLPKITGDLPGPGSDSTFTLLNVLGDSSQANRYIIDTLNCGRDRREYYGEADLTIGTVLNCYGRKVVITDCDPFTKEYYHAKYGLDSFVAIDGPNTDGECQRIEKVRCVHLKENI